MGKQRYEFNFIEKRASIKRKDVQNYVRNYSVTPCTYKQNRDLNRNSLNKY